MPTDPLELGLAAGFGPALTPAQSVLRVIERITGEAPRVLLRDSASDHGTSPVMDLSSPDRKAVPQGRGSYQILGEIARGGMGVVMKGHDTDLGRDVALKVLHKNLAQRPEVVQRFVEEAQIGGQLQHPGIVPVYELGLMADERPYFTMKLVKGRTLAVLLSERKIATAERRKLLDVFESVCQTLAYAHSRGVIHRDLKPANVMVGAFGEVQVVDWGLAKVLASGGTADEKRAKQSNISIIETVRSDGSGSGSHSLVGSVMGTPAYMPPEQARGEIAKIDERSDVFSLGAILCEVLTGSPPYVGESEKTIEQAAKARLDDATARLDGCEADADLVALAEECLAPAQQARPRHAGIVAQRIHDYLISVEERARDSQVDAAEARVKAAEERKARKLTLALGSSVLVTVLVVGGGWAWASSERASRERDTETRVNAALNEATLRRGESKWAEALAAVERAQGLAASGAANAELRSRVATDVAAIENDTKLAREKEEIVRNNAALLAELEDVRQPEFGNSLYATDHAKHDRAFAAVFEKHGLDLDRGTVEEAAAKLSSRGDPVALAAMVHDWRAARSAAGKTEGAVRLGHIVQLLDPDETRSRLRAALPTQNVAELKAFAAREDLTSLSAATLNLLGLGLCYEQAFGEAVAVYRLARGRYPNDFVLARNSATALLLSTPPAYQEAARHLTAALALRPDSIEVRHQLGTILDENLGEHELAKQIFREAIHRSPNDAHLIWHLGNALERQGLLAKAIVEYRNAIKLDSTNAQAHVCLGDALRDQHQLDKAIEEYHTAAGLDPKDAIALCDLGILLLYDLDRVDDAIEAFRAAITRNPENAGAHNNLGIALVEQSAGNIDEAIAELIAAVALDGANARYHGALGFALESKHGFHEEAIKEYCAAIALDPTQTEAVIGLARLTGDYKLTIANYRRLLALDEKGARALSALAWQLATCPDLTLRNGEEAVGFAERARDLAPNDANSFNNLGAALCCATKWPEAIEALNHSIELNPGTGESGQGMNAVNHAFLALAYSQLSPPDLDEARKQLELAEHGYKAHSQFTDAPTLGRVIDEARAAIEAGGKK